MGATLRLLNIRHDLAGVTLLGGRQRALGLQRGGYSGPVEWQPIEGKPGLFDLGLVDDPALWGPATPPPRNAGQPQERLKAKEALGG